MDRNYTICQGCWQLAIVALRKESVDRNTALLKSVKSMSVALRKESVDRNNIKRTRHIDIQVALRKESVDRNMSQIVHIHAQIRRSPQGERG